MLCYVCSAILKLKGKFMQNGISGHSFIIVLLSILKMSLYIPFKALRNLTDVKDKHNILISCKWTKSQEFLITDTFHEKFMKALGYHF